MKCIVLLASPGAGKGTASDYIENKYGYKHISTGSLLRNEALVNEEIKSLIDKGLFVSNETVMDIFIFQQVIYLEMQEIITMKWLKLFLN